MKNINNKMTRFKNLWDRFIQYGLLSSDKYLNSFASIIQIDYATPTYIPKEDHHTWSYRNYHTLDHIDFGLSILDEIKSKNILDSLSQIDFVFIEMAWWYHDKTYSTDSQNEKWHNERTSGLSCFNDLVKSGMTGKNAGKIFDIIMATTHNPICSNSFIDKLEQKLICDIDLASLGGSYDDFIQRLNSVRKEYAQYSDDIFNKGHADVLRSFTNRPQIFYIPYFVDKYEKQSRENIDRWINSVK